MQELRHLLGEKRATPDAVLARRMVVYACVLLVLVGGLAGTFAAMDRGAISLWVLPILALSATLAERGKVQLWRGTEVEGSISNLPILFAAVLFGPLAAMVVAGASTFGARGWEPMRRLIYGLSRTASGGVAGAIALHASGLVASSLGSLAIATMMGGVALELMDLAINCLTFRLRGKPARALIKVLAPLVCLSIPLYTPLVALLVSAYVQISPWTLPLFLTPALAAQRLYGLYQDQRHLTDELLTVNDRLERANMSFATALVTTLDARDRYTAGHSAAVAIYARDIAIRLGLTESEQQLAHLCGLVHDIGKIGIPAGLVEKPGALTLEERRQMQEHPAIGERILSKVEDYAEISTIVRHHHERIDGMGYPDGLSGSDIPLLSRIIAVADAYNAMTSARPYRDAMPTRVARLRLAQGIEGQFDVDVVVAFEAILAGASEEYRSGTGSEFRLDQQDVYSEPLRIARVA